MHLILPPLWIYAGYLFTEYHNLPESISNVVGKQAHWMKNKNFMMFLTMAQFLAPWTADSASTKIGALYNVFNNVDLLRVVIAWIPFA
jgi:hypothetical protein